VKIGILGGTFDPIHNGHLAAAQSVADVFHADEIHFVPAYRAPHKNSHQAASAFHRFAMVAMATLPFPGFKTSSIEVDCLQKRYTVETLEYMNNLYPRSSLIFVLGTDMFQEIETWKDYRRLFMLAHFAVVHRPGFAFREDIVPFQVLNEDDRPDLPETPVVYYLPFVQQPVSSTEIRSDCRSGRDVRHQLPEPVWSYIDKHKLYNA
jgi:nicotinate-nucleotide adenylyltransferase